MSIHLQDTPIRLSIHPVILHTCHPVHVYCFGDVFYAEFIRHEQSSGYYHIGAYFLARVIIDVTLVNMLSLVLFSTVVYWMIGKTAITKIFWGGFDTLYVRVSE